MVATCEGKWFIRSIAILRHTTSEQTVIEALPLFPEFSALTMDHAATVMKYTEPFAVYCDFTFAVLWCWGMDRCRLSDLNGNLVIQLPDYTSGQLFMSFIGRQKVHETIESLFGMIKESDCFLPYLQYVPEDNLTGISLAESYQLTEDRNNSDYICDLSILSKMAGNQYERVRNMTNRFQKTYHWQAKEIDLREPKHWNDVMRLFTSWKEGSNLDLGTFSSVFERILPLTERIHIISIGLYVEKKLIGFSINEPKQADYVNCLFANTDTSYTGASAFLYKQTGILLLENGYRYLNNPSCHLSGDEDRIRNMIFQAAN